VRVRASDAYASGDRSGDPAAGSGANPAADGHPEAGSGASGTPDAGEA
jgi:hypothetical protein